MPITYQSWADDTAVSTVAGTDKLPLVQSATDYHVTPDLLQTYYEGTDWTPTGTWDFSGATISGDLVIAERADHASTPAAGFGYLWVKSDTPSSLIFTDDAGTDYDLTAGGSGDMVLASTQTNTGAKTFEDATLLLRNVADTFSGQFTSTITAARTWTLPDVTGTLVTGGGTASGTNTGDDKITTSTGPTTMTVGAVADGEYLKRSGSTVIGGTPSGGGGGGSTYVVLTGDVSSSSTSLGDVTGLGFTLSANTDYMIEYNLIWHSSAASEGLDLAVNGPASPDELSVHLRISNSTSAERTHVTQAYDDELANPNGSTSDKLACIRVFIQCGASGGTFIPRFAAENGGAASVTIDSGSYGILTEVTAA